MSTVVIIGAGELGASAAHALASRDRVGRVLFVDDNASAAAGKALDIQQSGPIQSFDSHLLASDDLSNATGSSVCILADRLGPPASEWQGEEGLAMLRRLVPYLSGAPLVFAGARHAELMLRTVRELGVRASQIVGSAPEALASAIRALVALEAQCSPNEVLLAVLGTPSSGFVVPWSEASIGGYSLERVLSQVQINRLEARAARLWPPGPYTLGMAAALTAEAMLMSSRRRVNALAMLSGEFGVRNRIGSLPVLVNRHGIVSSHVPVLNTRERVLVETSLGAK